MMIFRILCGEWIEPLWDCMRAEGENGASTCFAIFLPTLVMGNFMVLNLFLALLLNSFNSEELKSKKEVSLLHHPGDFRPLVCSAEKILLCIWSVCKYVWPECVGLEGNCCLLACDVIWSKPMFERKDPIELHSRPKIHPSNHPLRLNCVKI